MPYRNIIEFMRKRGYYNITAKDIHNHLEKYAYSPSYDAHEPVTTLEKKRDVEVWYVDFKQVGEGHLSHVFWMSKEQITLARRVPCLLLHDNTYQSNRYDLNVGLVVGAKNFAQSFLFAQAVVVGENTRDFEYQFSNWLIAVCIVPVLLFTDACVKANNAAKTVLLTSKHF